MSVTLEEFEKLSRQKIWLPFSVLIEVCLYLLKYRDNYIGGPTPLMHIQAQA